MAEGMLRHPPKHPHAKDLVNISRFTQSAPTSGVFRVGQLLLPPRASEKEERGKDSLACEQFCQEEAVNWRGKKLKCFFSLIDLISSQLGPLVGRSESLRTPTSSATKEMNKVMGRLRRGSSFTGGDLDNPANGGPGGSMVTPPGPGSRMKSGPEPVPSPWGGMLRPRDCSPAFTRLGNSAENSPEGSLSRWGLSKILNGFWYLRSSHG